MNPFHGADGKFVPGPLGHTLASSGGAGAVSQTLPSQDLALFVQSIKDAAGALVELKKAAAQGGGGGGGAAGGGGGGAGFFARPAGPAPAPSGASPSVLAGPMGFPGGRLGGFALGAIEDILSATGTRAGSLATSTLAGGAAGFQAGAALGPVGAGVGAALGAVAGAASNYVNQAGEFGKAYYQAGVKGRLAAPSFVGEAEATRYEEAAQSQQYFQNRIQQEEQRVFPQPQKISALAEGARLTRDTFRREQEPLLAARAQAGAVFGRAAHFMDIDQSPELQAAVKERFAFEERLAQNDQHYREYISRLIKAAADPANHKPGAQSGQ